MFKKISLIGLFAFALTGCSATYDFEPSSKTEKVTFIDQENHSIIVESEYAIVEVTALEKEISPWVNPRIKVKLMNKSNIMMPIKSSDIRMSFDNFWFDAIEYEIVEDDRDENFLNDNNFRMVHQVMPGRSIEMDLTFNAPKSEEYYTRKDVLIEIYTELSLFNVIYEIDKQ